MAGVKASEWRETRERFTDLADHEQLDVYGTDLCGGSRLVRSQFRLVAEGAGRMAGGAGYEAWLSLLRKKLQPLKPQYFDVQQTVSERGQPRTIPLSQIDPPLKKRRKKKSSDRVLKSVDPTALVEAVEGAELYMVVQPHEGNRFIALPEHDATYAAYVTLNRVRVKCVVHRPGGKRQRTVRREERTELIRRVCQASIELCELLEAETFAAEQVADTTKPSKGLVPSTGLSGNQAPGAPVRQEAMSVKATAKLVDVSEDTIRRAIKRKEIKAFRVGRLIRISLDEVRQFRSQRNRIG